jgi:hypothetical protein
MKQLLLLLTFTTFAFALTEIKLFQTVTGTTIKDEMSYFHFNVNVPKDHTLIIQPKLLDGNQTFDVQFKLKHNQRPTQTNFDAMFYAFQHFVNNYKEGTWHIGAYSRTNQIVKFEIYIFMVKREIIEEKIIKTVQFNQESMVMLENTENIMKSLIELKLDCNTPATLFYRDQYSPTIPNKYEGERFNVSQGSNFLSFNQTAKFLVNLHGKRGTICRVVYSIKLKYISHQYTATVKDPNAYDYYLAFVEEFNPTYSFLLSKHGEPLDYYVNYGEDPSKIAFPTRTRYQLKSKRIYSDSIFWGNSLTLKPRLYAIIGVQGGKKDQEYQLASQFSHHRIGFGGSVIFEISQRNPKIFMVSPRGFGPFKMDFYVDLAHKRRVTLSVRHKGVVKVLISTDENFHVHVPGLIQRDDYEFIFEGDNELLMMSDGYGSSQTLSK